MSKPRPLKASKASKARSRKPAAKAQRATQAVIRSPKPRHLRSVGSAKSVNLHRRPDTPVVEKAQSASLAHPTATASPAMERENNEKTFHTFSATANVATYQKALPEIGQAYVQLGFDFAQRLAQIKSPLEIPSVMSDLTSKQVAILQHFVFQT